jgi:type IV secretion system protein VirB9
MRKFIPYILCGLSAITHAQTASPIGAERAPVHLTRTPPNVPPDVDPLEGQIAADLQALQGASIPASSATVPAKTAATPVPKDFHPRSDMPLTPTAQAAVNVSEKWLTEATTPSPGPDGRVVYTYGSGLPTVVCAPLRVCIVELQAGEQLLGEPQIGDSVRWNIAPALYGKADEQTTLIVIKPQDSGLDTNLLITTDRRAYYLRLISKPVDYIARVSFAYPNDRANKAAWKQHEVRASARNEGANGGPSASLDSLHFDYEIKGKDTHIKPQQVFDDGSKTYIRMSPDIAARDLPVLVALGADGKPEMVNYRVKGNTYVADRLFDRAELVLGNGKKAQKVEIVRVTARKP